MKKIMFYRPLYSLGGTEIAMLNLVKKLGKYDLYIGYSDATSDKHLLERFSEFATVVNINEVKDFEVDIFITCSAHYNLVEAINNIKYNKFMLWIHHLVNVQNTVLGDEEETKKIDYIVTVSRTTANLLKKLFPKLKSKISAIYNVIDTDEIKEKANTPINLNLSDGLNLVTVARVCKEKGFERMLNLVKSFKDKNINFKWFVVGGNYYKEEFDRIRNLYEEFKENFEWFGFIDNPHNIVKQCDYSVLLSDDETWGLVLTEAMVLGVPCISSDFDVAFEQIKDGKNGVILSNSNCDSYIDRLCDIIDNKSKYKKAVSHYGYKTDAILRKWDELFDERERTN